MTTAIRTEGLTKRYGSTVALRDLDLEVPRGLVVGYLGPNGAGKTTTIRVLAGLLRPTSGTAEVLGLDVVRRRDEVHRRIGYLPGEFVPFADLTARQYLRYLGNLRGGASEANVGALAGRLGLELDRRIGALSHGNRQKVVLVQAFMHEPELLILDEPTTGLDPLVQHEFLALVRETTRRGATVFLSSHVLGEVQAAADLVAILRGGRLVVVEAIDALTARSLRRIELTFAGAPPVETLAAVAGVRGVEPNGSTVRVTVEGSTAELVHALAPYRVDDVVTRDVDLEEVFLTYYGPRQANDARERVPQDAA